MKFLIAVAIAWLTLSNDSMIRSASAQTPIKEPVPADVAQPPKDAHLSRSGVLSKILKPGRGRERAGDNDCVTAQYTIWKRDGSVLGGSRNWSQPANHCLRMMFPGMAETVRLMAIGERRRMWIPAHLTYVGDDDDKPQPLDVTIDFELLAIQKAPPIPPDLKAPPRGAFKTESGVSMRKLKAGKGKQHPTNGKRLLLHFSGWTASGKLIESSTMAGKPAVFDLMSVMPGWREALVRMVPGDKVRLWIPAAMAFGAKPRRGQPKGDLVYELELISIE